MTYVIDYLSNRVETVEDCYSLKRHFFGTSPLFSLPSTAIKALSRARSEGDKVWVYFKATGTHMGELNLLGITLAPTGSRAKRMDEIAKKLKE